MKPVGLGRLALRDVLGSLIAGALLLGALSAPVMEPPTDATSNLSAVSPLPPRAPLYQLATPSVPERQIGAAPSRGAVTGYGTGGMARVPGSPSNPPYR
jgi:hypothetical protein